MFLPDRISDDCPCSHVTSKLCPKKTVRIYIENSDDDDDNETITSDLSDESYYDSSIEESEYDDIFRLKSKTKKNLNYLLQHIDKDVCLDFMKNPKDIVLLLKK